NLKINLIMMTRFRMTERILIQALVGAFLACAGHLSLTAQEDGPQRVYMYLNFYQIEGNQSLVAELKYRPDKIFLPVDNVSVEFYQVTDTNDVLVGEATTGEDGKATLLLQSSDFVTDTSGSIEFKATYSGSESYRKASRDVQLKELRMMVDAEIIDSVKTLTITCNEIKNGEAIPVNDAEVRVLVKRLYSNLPIFTGSLEEGELSVEFPDDIPGGHFGEIAIISQIFEHDDYGTIERHNTEQWGIPVSFIPEEKPRALWSRAPVWIIIAISLALGAAWYHYFLSISKLLKIRKL
ncbi:MAG: hypothetical protein KDC80_24745, partial [Saprospiraceae bacterium]|nr:hypothetical protein [Saprospiraceae bacterium]